VALLLAAVASPAGEFDFLADPSAPHGLILSGPDRVADNLYQVVVAAVNGQELARREKALWLKPGHYEIKAINVNPVNRSFVPGLRGDRSVDGPQPLSLDVEAGKTYTIHLKTDSGRRSEWRVVVTDVADQ
jgi:hypothetical protein